MAKTPGSGRKKGTPNKKTLDAEAIAKKIGCNPFEVLLRFAANDWEGLGYPDETYTKMSNGCPYEVAYIEPETRLKAAKEAAEYLYPKRKAIEVTGDEGGPIKFKDASELSPEQRAAALKRIADAIRDIDGAGGALDGAAD
jgi:hypothetical protein